MTEYRFRDFKVSNEADDGRHDVLLALGEDRIRLTPDEARLVGCRLIEIAAIERTMAQIDEMERMEREGGE